jgi:3-oxoacyl-ACP reductase-like protein
VASTIATASPTAAAAASTVTAATSTAGSETPYLLVKHLNLLTFILLIKTSNYEQDSF